MPYTEIPPHPALASYIDAYWSVKGAGEETATGRILPDGCVDIIFNLGEDSATAAIGGERNIGEAGAGQENTSIMKSGQAYLIGTMTRPIDSHVAPGTRLLGVRFKPAAFSTFYKYASLHEITDDAVLFEKSHLPDLSFLKEPATGLNKFFLDKLSTPRHTLFPLLEEINRLNGQIRVEALAKRHFITVRQLERNFQFHIGVSPKEFINQVRFRHTLDKVRYKGAGESLSDIAYECGYYDDAHLCNEIKKYTGETPARGR